MNDLEHMAVRLLKDSRTDDLTGLGNRRAFMEYCGMLQGLKVPFAVVLLDMTNLKRANEVLGHFGADLLLRRVGDAIRTARYDAAFRYGGDEFAVVLPRCDRVAAVLDRIEKVVGVTVLDDGTKVRAIGAWGYIGPDVDLYDILNQIDNSLERRKAAWKAK